MSNVVLGELPSSPQRDAVHVAVISVICGDAQLEPGQKVGIRYDDKIGAVDDPSEVIGVVDPFLTEPIMKHQRFWLLLNPNSTQNLHHVWSHPDFPDDDDYDEHDNECERMGCW